MGSLVRPVLRRLVLAVPLLFVVATTTFFLEQLVPGNIGAEILGEGATPAEIRAYDVKLGVNRPVLDQYITWIGRAVHGDFGSSWSSGQSVAHTIAVAAPVTISLAVVALVVSIVCGAVIGTAAAVRSGAVDRTLQGLSSVAIAIPGFWLGVGLIFVLAIKVRWLPATGYVPLTTSPGAWARSSVLPVIALSLGPIAVLSLQVRSAMIDVFDSDFIRSLRAAGLSRRSLLFKHAMRSSAAPVLTVVGFQFLALLAGSVVIEQLFDLPGLGGVLLAAVESRDVPVVEGVVILYAVFVVVINLVVDTSLLVLDPRTRDA